LIAEICYSLCVSQEFFIQGGLMPFEDGKRVLAVIPARGGSKRLPNKNLRVFSGKPLLAWTILEARKCSLIDEVVVSTDSPDIAKIAIYYGAIVPELRSPENSGDSSLSISVIREAIEKTPSFEVVVMLQPTSPLRSEHQITEALTLYNKLQSPIVSVKKATDTPFWMFVKNESGRLESLFPEYLVKRSQNLEDTYSLNGAIYIDEIQRLLRNNTFIQEETYPYEMDSESSLDIDTLEDFNRAEVVMKNRQL